VDLATLTQSLSHFSLALLVCGALFVLARAADALVQGSSALAYRLGVPKVIVGATIVSLGTTSPEAAVSVMAAWAGKPGLALGNAVGSVIADTALIFGLCCTLTAVRADRFVLQRQGWLQFGSAVLLAALCYGAWYASGESAALGRPVGALLLTLLALYLLVSIRWSQEYESADIEESAAGHVRTIATSIALIVCGLVIVVLSSHVLIEGVSELALRLGLSRVVIAATIVAFGTSLPELMVGLSAVRHGHADLLVGNVIGADILNVLFVIGASALAAPLPILDPTSAIPTLFLTLHLPTMLLVLALFRLYIFQAVRVGSFSRWMGAPLLAIYASYCVIQFVIGRS
jgi:cation:H+ antiporter